VIDMRQWELFGITDSDIEWSSASEDDEEPVTSRRVPVVPRLRARERPMFFWSTDASLRLQAVSGAATRFLGAGLEGREGQDILDVFGMEGPNLSILESHASALAGETTVFVLEGPWGRLRCRVAPSHDGEDRVMGTFCIATRESREPMLVGPRRVDEAVKVA
jgi:PAS domain-containing protein